MRIKCISKWFIILPFLLLFSLQGGAKDAFSAQVDKDEAAAVADLWYAMELNSGHLKIDKAQRDEKFNKLQNRKMLYMTSKDNLLDSPPADNKVLAYVVKYEPSGFVVVSGDDRLKPVMVFDAESEFRWDEPGKNFLRYFLGKEMPARLECTEAKAARGETVDVHPNWTKLRLKVKESKSPEQARFESPEATQAVFVLWDTPVWDQSPHYNDTVIANNGGNDVPTGCVATAMAEMMRFHQWPQTGNGARTYNDAWGSVRFTHTVDYGNQTYNWANMPMTNLTDSNPDVADLMYHAGVAVNMDYEVEGSGAYLIDVGPAMGSHFRYKGGEYHLLAHRSNAYISIVGGLPVIMGGSKHAIVADGYRQDEDIYYHMNVGWGGACNGWYDVDDFPANSGSCSGGAVSESHPYSSPDNYIYVDGAWKINPDGRLQWPYDTITAGYNAVPWGGHLWVIARTYPGSYTFDKPMTISSYLGAATIGP